MKTTYCMTKLDFKTSHSDNCKQFLLITDQVSGEIICSKCGIVYEKSEVFDLEMSIYDTDYFENSRAGRNTSLKMADMGLSTVIQNSDKDASGKSLSSMNQQIFHRLRMWDRNSRYSSNKKSFSKAFLLLDAIRSKIALPEVVIEQTAYLFRKIVQKKILSGRSTHAMLCATVYIACRMTDTPRTIEDIANAGNVKKKILQRAIRLLIVSLEIYPESYSPEEFVTRLSNLAGISEKTRRETLELLSIASTKGVSTSKNPMSVAAAAIHVVSLKNYEKISQLKIAGISGISAVTIRDRAKELKKIMGVKNGQNV